MTSTLVCELEWVEGRSPFSDLEPIGTATVPACSRSGCLAQVDSGRALVVDSVVELEANSRAGGNIDGGRSSTRVDVTTNVVGSDGGDGRVVDWLTNGSRGGRASRNKRVPDVYKS